MDGNSQNTDNPAPKRRYRNDSAITVLSEVELSFEQPNTFNDTSFSKD